MRFVGDLWLDARVAIRTLGRHPGFTVVAVLTLALGIGANTAAFSVFDAVLGRPLPVRQPHELVVFDWLRTSESMVASYSGYGRQGPGPGVGIRTSFSYLSFERLRDRNRSFADLFAFADRQRLTVVADGAADTASGQFASGNYYSALGVPALNGRVFTPADDAAGAAPVAVITHRYWQRRFNGDAAIVGRSVTVNRTPVTIVGVTPETFNGTLASESSDVTLPMSAATLVRNGTPARPSLWWVRIMGRLKPGTTREQAHTDVHHVFDDSVRESWALRPVDTPNPARAGMPELRILDGAYGPDGPRRDAMQTLSMAFAIVGAILLIACANVAGLLLVRGLSRRHEMTTRRALGASRSRIIRQLLVESAVLAAAGGAAGVAVAFWGRNFLQWLPTSDTPIASPAIDWRVLLFAGGLSLVTALIFGIWPALRASRESFGPAMRASTQGIRRGIAGRMLVAAQLAICLMLLSGTGLALRTLRNFNEVDIGFDPDNLLVFRIDTGAGAGDASRTLARFEDLVASVEAVPGVTSATLSAMPVLARSEWTETIRADRAQAPQEAFIQTVRWNFFDTMGIPLLAGRALVPGDQAASPVVAIINETMAKQAFGEARPIGRRFQPVTGAKRNTWIEVVGLVADAKYAALDAPAPPTFYLSYAQMPPGSMTFEVRTATDPIGLIPAVRQAVSRVDPTLALSGLTTQTQQIAQTIARPRGFAAAAGIFSVVGLLLACIGIYGVVAFDVARRTHEIGLRLALGARRLDVLGLIFREVMAVVAVGAVVGTGLAVAANRLIAGLLFGVSPTDPATLAAAIVVLTVVAALAAYMPARRASRLNPTQAIRSA